MRIIMPLVLASCVLVATAQQAQPNRAGGILFWSPEQQIAGYRAIDSIYPTREIKAGERPFPLIPAYRDMDDFRYAFDKRRYSIREYMDANNVAGLIAVKNGRVIVERYGLGNDARSRWISFSIAKSVVSMLIGAAIRDDFIVSVEDAVVDYLPRLRGSAYEGVTIRNLLNMASGVRWNEDYSDPNSDIARLPAGTLPMIEYLGKLPRVASPGETFNYNTAETNLAGALLRSAIGNNLSIWLGKKIWKPFGMESHASWLLEGPDGVEYSGCCINATLRDYARIGVFALRNGVLPDGTPTLPDNWMVESTTPAKGAGFYGYFWWLMGDGAYAAEGIFGQMIWIDPTRDVVIAMHSAWPEADDERRWAHAATFARALADAL